MSIDPSPMFTMSDSFERPEGALHLQRLRVEQLRRFNQSFELDGLRPGLNIIGAPNESGKTTLVRALRAAFFERYRSTSVGDLRPWGDAQASPTVELDFLLDGQPHHLLKRFFSGKRCSLRIGERNLEGTDAEDHLAERFGFQFAARGGSKAEHWGIPGLLWVEQGSAPELAVQPARDHLHQALRGAARSGAVALADDGTDTVARGEGDAHAAIEDEAADLVAHRGDALLKRFKAQRAQLLTDTGKPRQALAEAIQAVAEARTAEADLRSQIEAYRDQVDELQQAQADWQHTERDKPWETLERQLAEARDKQQALQEQGRQLMADEAALAQLQQNRRLLEGEVGRAAEVRQQFEQRQQVEQSARQTLDALTHELQAQRQGVDAATDKLNAARAQAKAARQRADQAREREQLHARQQAANEQLAQQQRQADDAAARLQQAEAKALAARQARERLVALPAISEAQLKQLQRAESARREARLALEAVATRLAFELVPGQSLLLQRDGQSETLDGQGERRLDRLAELHLPGVGKLRIEPGGADLTERQRRAEAAERAFKALCDQLQVTGSEQAHERWIAVRDQQQLLQVADKELAIVAPDGLGALQQAHEAALAECQRLRDRLAALGPAAPAQVLAAGAMGEAAEAIATAAATAAAAATATGSQPGWHAGSLAEALAEEGRAEQAESAAEAAERAAQHTWHELRQRHSVSESQWRAATQELRLAQERLAAQTDAGRLRQAQDELLSLQSHHDALQARVRQSREALARARPEFVALDIQRLTDSVAVARQEHQRRRDRRLMLEASLQQAGAQGLEEQLAKQAAETTRVERRQQELQRRADALDWLCQRLESHRQHTLNQLQAPLQQRLQYYLPLLMPGARLVTDDQLAPQALARPAARGAGEGRTEGPLDQHSYGAREQLAMLCRLAYADLLQAAGRPTLLILDDALTHTDADRLAQMKRVLFDAARRHQILLFTCHPNAWTDAGVAVRRLLD